MMIFAGPGWSSFLFRRLILPLSAVGCLLAPRAHGYALEGKAWPANSVITLQMELGSTSGKQLQDGSSSWNVAAAPATDLWNQVMQRAQFATVMDSSAPLSSGDGVNCVTFSGTIFGDAFGTNVLAVTYYRSSNGTMLEADVLFNKAQTFDSYRGDLQFDSNGKFIGDIRRILLHELGHALGLDHPDDHGQHVDAIMNSVVSDEETLQPDDIAGIQSLYGPPALNPPPTPSPSPSASPTPGLSGSLVNISTRMPVGVGEDVLIGGFIIQGTKAKRLIFRGLGPSLSESGITDALADPQLELHDGSGALIASNDNWEESKQAAEISATGIPPTDAREAAILSTLDPGSYTVVLSGANATSGVALVEAYALDSNQTRAVNLSTRGRVGVGDQVLIGGFIVSDGDPEKVLLRALGPSLGVDGFLANPLLELHDASGNLIATDDDWASGGQNDDIVASGIPPTDSREAALIATLPSGNYTAVVRGADGGSGIALVEIYDLQ